MRCNKERLFDHPVGGSEQVRRDAEAECLGSLEIMTNRNFVGRCTGRSPGCSPLRKRLLDQRIQGLSGEIEELANAGCERPAVPGTAAKSASSSFATAFSQAYRVSLV